MPNLKPRTSLGSLLGHNFLTGMFLILPIGLTLYIVTLLIGFVASPVQSLIQTLLPFFLDSNVKLPDFQSGPAHVALSSNFGTDYGSHPHRTRMAFKKNFRKNI
jgi:hypothetical protein